jgi:hypothetical protein
VKTDANNILRAHGPDGLRQRIDDARPEKIEQRADRKSARDPHIIVSKAEFLRDFVAPDYLVDGILHRRFVYALTGQTGHAKTAIALLIAEQVASADPGATLGRHDVKKGRVVYFCGENPDDVRMRMIGADSLRAGEPAQDRLSFVVGALNIGEIMAALRRECADAPLDLVIVDTSAAYFQGDDEISNTEMGRHARMLRALTGLPGGPCVLVLCHPIKHVADSSQLLPRGGGAFLAEMDGNLTLWKRDDILVELHHNKIRGPGFEPMTFRLDKFTTPKLKDVNGRLIPTVRAVHVAQDDEKRQTIRAREDEDRVLAHLLRDPDSNSQRDIALGLGWIQKDNEPARSRVQRAVDRLKEEKPALIKTSRGELRLTEKGKEAAREAAAKLARETEKEGDGRGAFDP